MIKNKSLLTVLSTITWFVIILMLVFSRAPMEERIAQAVQSTMQARADESSANPEPLFFNQPDVPTLTPAPAEIPGGFPTDMPTDDADPCLYARLAGESVRDGSQFKPGASFTKTWVFENTGSCTWMSGFRLVFTGGRQMSGPSSVRIGQVVAPGERIFVSVNLTAPSETGIHHGNWMLQTDGGVRFAPVWVEIEVLP